MSVRTGPGALHQHQMLGVLCGACPKRLRKPVKRCAVALAMLHLESSAPVLLECLTELSGDVCQLTTVGAGVGLNFDGLMW